MSTSSHIRSVLIGVELRLSDIEIVVELWMFIYFLLFCFGEIKSKLNYRLVHNLQTDQFISYKYVLKSVLIEFDPSKYQKVNKWQKFDNTFNIRGQLEHFEYEMNRTQGETVQ